MKNTTSKSKPNDVICRVRQKNRGFTIVDNTAIDDMNLSIEAVGVYNVFKRWSTYTADDFVCSKSFIQSKCRCAEKKFERIWRELKENGYIKMYCVGKSNWSAELLEDPEPDTPHTIYMDNAGNVKRTVGGPVDQSEIPGEEPNSEENLNPPQNGGDLENASNPPHLSGDLASPHLLSGGLKQGNHINTFYKHSNVNTSGYKDSINQSAGNGNPSSGNTRRGLIDGDLIRETREQICYDSAVKDDPLNDRTIDCIVDCLVQLKTASCPMEFNKVAYDPEFIRARAHEFNYNHVGYVVNAYLSKTGVVKNPQKYLLTSVFNAPATFGAYEDKECS